ncbi:MAG: type II secretion system F family protein [Candidatus Gottesmanbacteria bacterium]|nr:type II secretion system F family protein [Candidatus Gottesmanbacteria bacterium]
MPVFQYKARGNDGKMLTGLVDAPSQEVAIRLLHEKQLFVIGVAQSHQGFSFAQIEQYFKRVTFNDIVNFTRQLSTMVVAGLSLPEALTILRNQTTNQAFSDVLVDIEHQIVSGGNLGDALSKYPKYFSATYIALIRAGEASGTLDEILTRLSETLEAEREFKGKVSGAMIYPVIILIGMVGVIFVMMTVVMPKLTGLYKDFNIELPWSTVLLMSMSDFFVHFWWLMIFGIVAAVWLFRRWRKTPLGELLVDQLIFKIPLFGELQKKIILVDFTRTLGMLVASGIHILEGLQILKNSLGNVMFRNAIGEISKKVEKGFPLGDSFAQYAVFPPIVSQMMKVGEETGKLDETLTKLSKYFQSESETLVKGLTTAIEPIIMVIMGVGVGFIVISVITPIYNLTSQFK